MSRRLARQVVIQTLFQMDLAGTDADQALDQRLQDVALEDKDRMFVRKLVQGVTEHRHELDRAINFFADDWEVSRLASVDRSILRAAIYELKYFEDTPRKVSVNEAVELAKVFGDDQSPKFINGILGSVVSYIEEDEQHA